MPYDRHDDETRDDRLERRLQEAFDELSDDFVDPRDAYLGDDGQRWRPIRGAGLHGADGGGAFDNEQELAEIRDSCRALAATNEFAINGHENRVSFLVGAGHTYRAAVRKGREAAEGLPAAVQEVLDEFVEENHWRRRQQEIVRRRDRDGEVFLRFFPAPGGAMRVRFVEPDQVAAPQGRDGDPSASFGIQTDPQDVETVLAYFIDGRPVDAAEIQHRKAHVDGNVKRGLPLYYPVRKNLRRAERLLRNMSAVAEIQSAIALIRRHTRSSRSAAQQFAASSADAIATGAATGRQTRYKRYAPGSILDVHGGVEYEFPAAALDAGSYVAVLQAELRAIASRLVMPEFMLTSDASNANYSSTMVAEGPAMRMFARLQAELAAEDLQVMRRVVRVAVTAGRLSEEALVDVEIQVGPPALAVRDPRSEAEALRIEHEQGILSPQTWSQRRGLDYDQEQRNIAEHVLKNGLKKVLPGGEGKRMVVSVDA